jgi:NTP pyrophosphatase (non-canonical NTP hydrolase)
MILQDQIKAVNNIRLKMWPSSALFNIVEFDHLLATLIEEAGELRQVVRSFFGRPFSPEKSTSRKHMIEELGDVLVPIIALSNQMEIPFEEALDAAIVKLNSRLIRKQECDRLDATFNKLGGTGKESIFDFNEHQPFQWDPTESPK